MLSIVKPTHSYAFHISRACPRELGVTLPPMTDAALTPIEIGLTAAIVAVEGEEPAILVAGDGSKGAPRAGLPFGPFDPLAHRTFEIGLRAWVEAQTGLTRRLRRAALHLRRPRPPRAPRRHRRAYGLGRLSRAHPHAGESSAALSAAGAGFEPWYRFFPWEDWREGGPRFSTRSSCRC